MKPLASAPAAQRFTLKTLRATGSSRYTTDEIVAASGLKIGATVTADDLNAAANRLAQAGVFSQVRYSYDGESASYIVADAPKLVPIAFENFIWFTDAELLQAAKAAVPLFHGQVPPTGSLADQVAAALDEFLKKNGKPGHAEAMMQGQLGGDIQLLQYRVSGIQVKIAEMRFPGAALEHVPMLQEATNFIIKNEYLHSVVAPGAKQSGTAVYGHLGYLNAQLGDARAVVLQDGPEPVIAVEIPIEERHQYTFAGVNWSGATTLPADELEKTIQLHTGAPADTVLLGRTVAALKALYGTHGYMNADAKTTATLNNENYSAVFNIAVKEGPQYRMGKLEVQNLDDARTALVKRVWGLREGDVYDGSYMTSFLQKHASEMPPLAGWRARFTQTIHDDTHIVDLVLKFEKFQAGAR